MHPGFEKSGYDPRIFPSGTRQNAEEARKEGSPHAGLVAAARSFASRTFLTVPIQAHSGAPSPSPTPPSEAAADEPPFEASRVALVNSADDSLVTELPPESVDEAPHSVHEALSAEALELYGDDYDGEDRDLITNRIEKTFVDLLFDKNFYVVRNPSAWIHQEERVPAVSHQFRTYTSRCSLPRDSLFKTDFFQPEDKTEVHLSRQAFTNGSSPSCWQVGSRTRII
ncbi:hypothetical protein PAPYR_11373 [Paratrimastix pyriformis]|uniref:Uncharacterized protein n=1 Tax=Paratrimastix pyriformis TaxID=342808 RepID=A0ABQ8U5M6_9EUKA|nr:hypothetical protein PAPYR_11373 [Paratrimastix pyriformis]